MAHQLWVGNTEIWGSEEQLIGHIRQKCGVVPKSVWFCKNRGSGELEGYGFVDFNSSEDAVLTMRMLKDTPIPHAPDHLIRLNWGNARPETNTEMLQQATGFQVYVGNLPASVTNERLLQYFQRYFPDAISARLIHGPDGFSKGFGFVKFHTFREVQDAIRQLNGSTELGRVIKVSEAATNRIHNTEVTRRETSNETLFIRDIDPEIVKEDTLRHHFSPYGNVVAVRIVDGHPDWAYVQMETKLEAESARNALQGSRFGGTTKCDIQFGRAVEESGPSVQVTVPVIEKPKTTKRSEFFNDEGTRRVVELIQRYGDITRHAPIVESDPHLSNRLATRQCIANHKLFEWGYSDHHAPLSPFWYF